MQQFLPIRLGGVNHCHLPLNPSLLRQRALICIQGVCVGVCVSAHVKQSPNQLAFRRENLVVRGSAKNYLCKNENNTVTFFIRNEKDELIYFLYSLPFALRVIRSLVLQVRLFAVWGFLNPSNFCLEFWRPYPVILFRMVNLFDFCKFMCWKKKRNLHFN